MLAAYRTVELAGKCNSPRRRQRLYARGHVDSVAEDIIASKPLELLRSSKADGMGIGLFVVQTAVGNHRGQVHLGRSVGLGGAQVVLDLPKQAGRPTPEPFTERRVRDRRRPFW